MPFASFGYVLFIELLYFDIMSEEMNIEKYFLAYNEYFQVIQQQKIKKL